MLSIVKQLLSNENQEEAMHGMEGGMSHGRKGLRPSKVSGEGVVEVPLDRLQHTILSCKEFQPRNQERWQGEVQERGGLLFLSKLLSRTLKW